jgi:hypothetical protein
MCLLRVSRSGLCDGPVTHPGEYYGVCVCVRVIEEPHRGGLDPLDLSSYENKQDLFRTSY